MSLLIAGVLSLIAIRLFNKPMTSWKEDEEHTCYYGSDEHFHAFEEAFRNADIKLKHK